MWPRPAGATYAIPWQPAPDTDKQVAWVAYATTATMHLRRCNLAMPDANRAMLSSFKSGVRGTSTTKLYAACKEPIMEIL